MKLPTFEQLPFHLEGGGPNPLSLKLGEEGQIPAKEPNIYKFWLSSRAFTMWPFWLGGLHLLSRLIIGQRWSPLACLWPTIKPDQTTTITWNRVQYYNWSDQPFCQMMIRNLFSSYDIGYRPTFMGPSHQKVDNVWRRHTSGPGCIQPVSGRLSAKSGLILSPLAESRPTIGPHIQWIGLQLIYV